MAHCSHLPYVPLRLFFFFFFFSRADDGMFFFCFENLLFQARDRITSFRADELWFSMGYDFVFRCTRICRLFRRFFSFPFLASSGYHLNKPQYLYALLSIPSGSQTECHGTHCFRVTFTVCAVSCFVGSVGLWLLGRRWKV